MADDDKKKPVAPSKPIEKRKEEKKKEKPDPIINKIDKGVQDVNKNLDSLIKRAGNSSNRAEQRADLLLKAADAQKKIDELNASGRKEEASALQASFDETSKLLKGSKTDAAIGNRLAELALISQDTSDLIEKYGSKEDQDSKENLSGINGIISKLEEQKKSLDDDTLNQDLGRQLKALGGAFGRNLEGEVGELQDAYDSANADLTQALEDGDEEAAAAAREQLAAIAEGAESEENRREALKLNEEANSWLFQMASSMESFGSKLDDVASKGAKGAGILAGLTGLALMFIDPEKFQEIMVGIIDKASIVFQTIAAVLQGDFDTAGQLFSDNMGTFGVLIGSLGLLFAGKIIKVIGTAIKVARVFRIFMMGTFIPTLYAAFMSMMTALAPIVVAMAPILLPVLAIMALIGGLYYGFKKLQDSLGPGASIMDTLKVGMLYFVDFLAMIVNGITWIPRKILGFLGPRLMKWIMGDDFDTSAIENLAAGFDTNRGATAAAEIKAKNEAAAAEKAKEEAKEDPFEASQKDTSDLSPEDLAKLNQSPTTTDGQGMIDTSTENAAAQGGGQTTNAVITNATGGTSNVSNVVTSTTVQTPMTQAAAVLGSVTSR